MRLIRTAMRGLLHLFAALCLTNCAGSGTTYVPTPTAVEVPVPVPIRVPASLTEPPSLPGLPTPAFRDAGACAAGCFTNGQLRDVLDDVLAAYLRALDRLHSIRVYSDERAGQIEASNHPQPHANQQRQK